MIQLCENLDQVLLHRSPAAGVFILSVGGSWIVMMTIALFLKQINKCVFGKQVKDASVRGRLFVNGVASVLNATRCTEPDLESRQRNASWHWIDIWNISNIG